MKTMKQNEIGPLMRVLKDAYARQLASLGPRAFSKKTLEDLKAGFADGTRSMLMQLERDGYLDIDRSEAPDAVTPVAPAPPPPAADVPAADAPMRVVDKNGHEVARGAEIIDFRGDKARLVGPERRNRSGLGGGKVLVEIDGRTRTFNAGVYGLEVL